MNNTIKSILNLIHNDNPEELQRVKDSIEKMNTKERENPITEAVFEVDDKLHRVPFEQLKSFLHGDLDNVSDEPTKQVTPRKGNRIPTPSPEAYDLAKKREEGSEYMNTEPYYWDLPENQYKHMSEDAIRDRVLNKKR